VLGRVTQGTITNQLLRNINKNLGQMQGLQEQLSTGMKLNRPSDDPVGITYSLRYRSDLSLNERYQENVTAAASWLDYSDTLLNQVGEIVKRAKELAIQGSNGTNPNVALDNVAAEMKQLKDQLQGIGNSQFKGKYVFNGQFTDVEPYTDLTNAAKTLTDDFGLEYLISSGAPVRVNLTGNDVFGYPPSGVTAPKNEDDNLFHVLDQMIQSLEAGDHAGVAAQLPFLDTRANKILTQRAELGARVNRVELMEQRLQDLNLNLTTLQSKTEDADIEDVLIKSKVNESVYQASLSVGAKVIQPSLVDFLR